MTSRGSPEEKRLRAQAHFEKGEQRKVEAAKSFDDHRAKIGAEAAKTIRLRALRLAEEAADALAAETRAAEKKAALAAKPARKKSVRKKSVRAKPAGEPAPTAES